jgi:hypothetical protein
MDTLDMTTEPSITNTHTQLFVDLIIIIITTYIVPFRNHFFLLRYVCGSLAAYSLIGSPIHGRYDTQTL